MEKAQCFWCEKNFKYSIDDETNERSSIDQDGMWHFWDEYKCPHCGEFTNLNM